MAGMQRAMAGGAVDETEEDGGNKSRAMTLAGFRQESDTIRFAV